MEYNISLTNNAEVSVIGSILIDQRAFKDAAKLLSAEDFYNQDCRALFSAAYKLVNKGEAFDSILIVKEAENATGRDLTAFAGECMRITPTASNVTAYARIVRQTSEMLQIQRAVNQSEDSQNPTQYIIDKLQKIQRETAARTAERTTTADALQAFLAKCGSEAYRPISTGLPEIDRAISGGIFRQTLTTLGAAPAVGKTMLLQQIAENMAAAGQNVIFINLEMSREQLFARSLSRYIAATCGNMTPTDILQGYKWTVQQKRQVESACNEYAARIKDRLVYNPVVGDPTVDNIMKAVYAAADIAESKAEKAPIVILDYAQIVQNKEKADDDTTVKEILFKGKEYAIKHDTAFIVVTANNRRSNETGRAALDSGRGTSSLEYSGDVALQLTYAACDKKAAEQLGMNAIVPDDLDTQEEKYRRTLLLRVCKNRMGKPDGRVILDLDAEHSTFNVHEFEKTMQSAKTGYRNTRGKSFDLFAED